MKRFHVVRTYRDACMKRIIYSEALTPRKAFFVLKIDIFLVFHLRGRHVVTTLCFWILSYCALCIRYCKTCPALLLCLNVCVWGRGGWVFQLIFGIRWTIFMKLRRNAVPPDATSTDRNFKPRTIAVVQTCIVAATVAPCADFSGDICVRLRRNKHVG